MSPRFRPSSIGGGAEKQRLFPEQLNIIYDSKCGICKLEMDLLARRDARLAGLSGGPRKLKMTDIECQHYNPEDPANAGVSYEEGMAAIHAVTSDGRLVKGVPVFSRAYDLVGLGWLFKFTEWPMMKPIVHSGYTLFAKYRTVLTRGSTLEELIKVRNAKKLDECISCSNLKR